MANSAAIELLKSAIGWQGKRYREKLIAYYRLKNLGAMMLAPFPIPIGRLFRLFGSDKESPKGHRYAETYGRILRPLKYRRIRVLEIGIGGYSELIGGGSILSWKAFFPRGRILACDIEPRFELRAARIEIMQADQSSADDLARISAYGPFDLIVDDGSHRSHHQLFTFHRLFPHLNPGGFYVIEDVQTSFWPGKVADNEWNGRHLADPEFRDTCVGYFQRLAAYTNHAEIVAPDGLDHEMLAIAPHLRRVTFEHNLIVVERGANDTPSNMVRPLNDAARRELDAASAPTGRAHG